MITFKSLETKTNWIREEKEMDLPEQDLLELINQTPTEQLKYQLGTNEEELILEYYPDTFTETL